MSGCSAHRYETASARPFWLSRDPIEENGGINLYVFTYNDPISRIDYLGQWASLPFGGDHDTLTRASLKAADLELVVKDAGAGEDCANKIVKVVIEANLGQDSGAGASDMPRHFNRRYFPNETDQEIQTRRNEARNAYAAYLKQEEAVFAGTSDCWSRLKALGRMSHSWQDYYGHGIHATQGFIDPITGAPKNLGDFWPSSYHSASPFTKNGEHGNLHEPVLVGSQRYRQAQDYVEARFAWAIVSWLSKCACECKNKSD